MKTQEEWQAYWRLKSREFRERNPNYCREQYQRQKEYHQQYYRDHPPTPETREKDRIRQNGNPKYLAYHREYYQNNREKIREYYRKRYQLRKECDLLAKIIFLLCITLARRTSLKR